MIKKIFLFGLFLLIAGKLFADAESKLITVSADGTETTYVLSEVQKIVFDGNSMTVNMKSGFNATDITCVHFLLSEDVGVKNPELPARVFIFPNPVTTNLTVSGTDKDLKINLFDLSGKLLKSVPAQDNSTNIDVTSLQRGVYLLQVGGQVLKFVKK